MITAVLISWDNRIIKYNSQKTEQAKVWVLELYRMGVAVPIHMGRAGETYDSTKENVLCNKLSDKLLLQKNKTGI